MSSVEAKDKIIKLLEKYPMDKAGIEELIENLKEHHLTDNDNIIYKFCRRTLSSYCGYCINSNGHLVVFESKEIIEFNAKDEIVLKDDKKFLEDQYGIIGFEKLDTKNGYIINSKNNNSPYLKIVNREIKLATNVDVYKFMAGAGWLENTDNDKKYKQKIEENFPDECLEIHHINNNPNDNRVENLIYLPRSIHHQIHSCANK